MCDATSIFAFVNAFYEVVKIQPALWQNDNIGGFCIPHLS